MKTTFDGLVLDLRDNPGGLLNEGVAVADQFLQKGQTSRFPSRSRFAGEKLYRAATATTGTIIPSWCW